MRELRFRAWDKGTKSLFLVSGCWFEEQGNCHETDLQKIAGNIILMQYTGLKDKNGKEIYSDDLIQWGSGNNVYQIIWVQDECRFGLTRKELYGTYNLTQLVAKNCEIRGNIYENPELIND